MASELALKVAECIDYVLDNELDCHVWRGVLSTGEWKVMISQTKNDYIHIQVKQRADNNGDPV